MYKFTLTCCLFVFAACSKSPVAHTIVGTWNAEAVVPPGIAVNHYSLIITARTWQWLLRDSVVQTLEYSLGTGLCQTVYPPRTMTKVIFAGENGQDEGSLFLETKNPNTLLLYRGIAAADGGVTVFRRAGE